MNQDQVNHLLSQALHQDQQIRENSLKQLDFHFADPNNLNLLFQLFQQGELIVTIYFCYWIKSNYSQLQVQQKQQIWSILYNHKYNEKHLTNTILYIFHTDYQQPNLINWFTQMQDQKIKYKIIKDLLKLYEESPQLQNHEIIHNMYLNTIQTSQQCDQEIYIKTLILNTSQINTLFLNELEQLLQTQQYRLIYLFQKLIKNILENKSIQNQELCNLLTIFNQYYFTNPQIKVIVPNQLQDILNYKEQQNINQMDKLILQVLQIIKIIVNDYTYNPLQVFDQNPKLLEFELMFYEIHFPNILQFLIRYSLLLTPNQIYDIYYQPENAFTESNNTSYEIRENSIDFLIVAVQSIKSDIVCEHINKQFKFAPELNCFENIIQKEAIYYLIRNVFNLMEFDIELYFEQFNVELNQTSPLFIPLKVQILYIIQKYLKNNEEVPQNIGQNIAQIVITLQNDNLCIQLLQIEIITDLLQLIDHQILYQLLINVQTVYSLTQLEQSKISIFNFFAELIKSDILTDFTWILDKFSQEFNLGKISIQEQILEVLQEILFRQKQITSEKVEYYANILNSTFQQQQQILAEQGIELLIQLQSKCNEQSIKINPQYIRFYQEQILLQLIHSIEHWNQLLLFQVYLIYDKCYDEILFTQTLFKMIVLYPELKEQSFIQIFIVIELYMKSNKESILSKQLGQQIMQYFQKEQIDGILLIRLVYMCNICNIILSKEVYEKCYQIHMHKDREFKIEHFKQLLQVCPSNEGQLFLEEYQQKTLEEPQNELRQLFAQQTKRVRMPGVIL